VRSRARQNALGHGASWGGKGEAAYEYELALRETMSDIDDEVRRAIERFPESVRSSYSPTGRQTLLRLDRDWGIRQRPNERAIFVATSRWGFRRSEMQQLDEIFDEVLAQLNRDWSFPGYEWFWDRVVPSLYEFSLGRRPWRWKRKTAADVSTVIPYLDTEDGPSQQFTVCIPGADIVVEAHNAGEASQKALEEYEEPVFRGGRLLGHQRPSILRIYDGRGELVFGEEPEDLEDNPKSVMTGPAWQTAREKLRAAAHGTRKNPPRVFRPQKVIAQLQKETRPAFQKGAVVGSPTDLMYSLVDYMGHRATELFLVLYISVRNQIIGYNEYSSGGVAEVEVHGSSIFRDALTSGAAAVITVHQHPTGDATPSDADRELWKRLREIGQLVGVPVLDNLVLGDGQYFSESEGYKSAIPAAVAAEARAR
jgi:hypothetical protein